jgi:hypothetical protein
MMAKRTMLRVLLLWGGDAHFLRGGRWREC